MVEVEVWDHGECTLGVVVELPRDVNGGLGSVADEAIGAFK